MLRDTDTQTLKHTYTDTHSHTLLRRRHPFDLGLMETEQNLEADRFLFDLCSSKTIRRIEDRYIIFF